MSVKGTQNIEETELFWTDISAAYERFDSAHITFYYTLVSMMKL